MICEVIVPCYGYGHFLEECVASVLRQSLREIQVTIVNDASPDDTGMIADSLARVDGRVKVIHHETNRGHIASYNEALELSAAEFTLILSADDILIDGSVARAVDAFRQFPNAALCYGGDIPFETNARRQSPSVAAGVTFQPYAEFLATSCVLGRTPIQAPTAFMRAVVQRRVGGFLESLPHTADTEIWLRLAAPGGVARVGADQAYRRLHASNMSLNYSSVRRLKEQERAFRTHFASRGFDARNLPVLRRDLAKALGEQAFWVAAHAFDANRIEAAAEALGYAETVYPAIRRTSHYRRLALKRTLGWRLSSAIQPIRNIFNLRGGDGIRVIR
jgi:glycosyltransferase involved in cell wall biosynthesis